MGTYSDSQQKMMDSVDMTEGRRGLVTMVSITLEEYHALKEENTRLKQHVQDLNSDFNSAEEHCAKFHVEGGVMKIVEAKVEEVYRCPECDESFADRMQAAYHCVSEDIAREYKCRQCGFVWPTVAQAIRCWELEVQNKAVGV